MENLIEVFGMIVGSYIGAKIGIWIAFKYDRLFNSLGI